MRVLGGFWLPPAKNKMSGSWFEFSPPVRERRTAPLSFGVPVHSREFGGGDAGWPAPGSRTTRETNIEGTSRGCGRHRKSRGHGEEGDPRASGSLPPWC